MTACAYWSPTDFPAYSDWQYSNELCEMDTYITVPLQEPFSGALRVPVCNRHKEMLLESLRALEQRRENLESIRQLAQRSKQGDFENWTHRPECSHQDEDHERCEPDWCGAGEKCNCSWNRRQRRLIAE